MFKTKVSILSSFFLMILFTTVTIPVESVAQVEVAFFEYRSADGRLTSIEPGGQFYHIAIKSKAGWLHAHPFYGVVTETDINKIGQLVSILTVDKKIEEIILYKQIGKKFSLSDSWENLNSTYCSKLVAQILNIKPSLMKNGNGWGLSPDDIYHELRSQNFSEKKSCRTFF